MRVLSFSSTMPSNRLQNVNSKQITNQVTGFTGKDTVHISQKYEQNSMN